jgi:hypothetical protein
MITQEYLKSIFEYCDGNLYWKVANSNRVKIGQIAGTLLYQNYIQIRISRKKYQAHRLIFLMHYGYLPVQIDHKNNNKADNRIENLRAATNCKNQYNVKIIKTNTSGCKNVTWSKKRKKWYVQLSIDNKRKYFGSFENLELAELVAIEARNKYHGDFARHK